MKERARLKVSSTTAPQKAAGAMHKFYTVDKQDFEVVAVGAGAISQATKAMILARRYISSSGIDLAFKPAFETIHIGEKEVTAIKWLPVEI